MCVACNMQYINLLILLGNAELHVLRTVHSVRVHPHVLYSKYYTVLVRTVLQERMHCVCTMRDAVEPRRHRHPLSISIRCDSTVLDLLIFLQL